MAGRNRTILILGGVLAVLAISGFWLSTTPVAPTGPTPTPTSRPVIPRSACGKVSRLFPGYSGRSSCCGRSKGPSTTRSRIGWEPLPVRLGSTTITR